VLAPANQGARGREKSLDQTRDERRIEQNRVNLTLNDSQPENGSQSRRVKAFGRVVKRWG